MANSVFKQIGNIIGTEINNIKNIIMADINTVKIRLTNVENTTGGIITKTTIGLSDVDNTTDLAKPISTATQTALDGKVDKGTTLNNYGIVDAISNAEKGVPNGVATLDATGLVPSTQLPSYVDDVLEFTNLSLFPTTGVTGKIYVDLSTNKTYRWGGTAYTYITSGAVDSVAGKTGIVSLTLSDIADNGNILTTNAITQTKNGGLTINGLLTANGAINRVTVDGNASWLQQDGTGRNSWYWNTYGGTLPVFTNSNEDASAITLSISNVGAGGSFFHRSASGVNKNAGDPITWTTTIYADLNNFTYKNYKIWHAGNDGSGSGLDADTLDGFNADVNPVANSIVARDGNGATFLSTLVINNNLTDGGQVTFKSLGYGDMNLDSFNGTFRVFDSTELFKVSPSSGDLWSKGVATLQNGLKIGGVTYPEFKSNIDFGSDVAGTWRKIIGASLVNSIFSTISFKIDVVDPNANHGVATSVDADIETYYVACVRSESTVLNTPDACYVRGPGNRIRAIKTAVGVYEIQIQNELREREYHVSVSSYTANSTHTITYFNGTVGGTPIATYDASVGGSVNHFENVRIAGGTPAAGKLLQSDATGRASWQSITKTTVGLSEVDNISDINKPISTATQTALDGKVDDSQVLTNVPVGALFTDTVYTHPATHAPSIIVQDASNRFVTDIEKSTWTAKAPTNSPVFTGIPTAPTATVGTNTTQLATTAYVKAEISAIVATLPLTSLVVNYTVSTVMSSLNITGLDINTHKSYKIEFELLNTGTATNIGLFTNGDLVDTNYYSQYFEWNNVTQTGSRQNSAIVAKVPSGSTAASYSMLVQNVGGYITVTSTGIPSMGATISSVDFKQTKTTTVTNLTQLTIGSNVSFGIGTKIRIYRGDL